MCLYVRNPAQRIRRTALSDKTVYKALMVNDVTGELRAPFNDHFRYTLGEVAESKLSEPVLSSPYVSFFRSGRVEQGLHSFISLKELKANEYEFILGEIPYGKYRLAFFECTIPKGSMYYKGHWRPYTDCPNIASDKLIVNKEVF